ncbi:fumarylacetoacetate hydrolase family protein [Pseudoalteromonas sp. T1lg48]|uniref:fumarylacetoacetate hydrolase family protein n=1 Tax=Pseudoalteromonas sp. T1lg48 TaxID=2077100 RepID=UPI000CF6D353|nr:fumarylacetoacetate hydrolase family protein [Pseudoalteromonas sp. T1lg48]
MVTKPGKITCIGRNYVEHIKELDNAMPDAMVIFNKPPSALADVLQSQHQNEALHYEGELCFAIKNNRPVAVAFALDLTKRALQSELKAKGLPWERAKSFDGAVLASDFVAIDETDIARLSLRLYIDGELIQEGQTTQMLYPVQAAIDELASWQRLQDGDWLLSGTPKGVGEVRTGQVFEGQVLLDEQVLVAKQWQAQ